MHRDADAEKKRGKDIDAYRKSGSAAFRPTTILRIPSEEKTK
jgi:hypothetical protein